VRERPADGFDLDRARTLLGVGPTATRQEVDAAYLRLVAFYDPAKVMDLGPEFVVLSVRRLGQATTAYQIAVDAVP
jgi:DnaJ-domain-containing protein 1